MPFTPASTGSLVVFDLLVLGVSVAGLFGVYRATGSGRTTGVAAAVWCAWLAALSIPVATGWIEAGPFPRLFVYLLASNLFAVGVALSPLGARLATLPLAALVGFQAFRLPLELVLHDWVGTGTIPETMTWTGSNVDIVSGVVALCAAPFVGRSRALAWVANVVGFVLLLNVARVALYSAPLPFAWAVEPPLQLPFHLPYALIVPVCVAGALAGHLVLTRRLLGGRPDQRR